MAEIPLNRNLGEQPIQAILISEALSPRHLVDVSRIPISHKLISRACKGRWLTPHSQELVRDALNLASHKNYTIADLFNY